MDLQEAINQLTLSLKDLVNRYCKATQGELFSKDAEINAIEIIYLNDSILTIQRAIKELEMLVEIKRRYGNYQKYGTSIHNRVEETIFPEKEIQEKD